MLRSRYCKSKASLVARGDRTAFPATTPTPNHEIFERIHIALDQNLSTSFNSIINNFDNFLFIEQTENLATILALYDSTAGEIWHLCGVQLGVTDLYRYNIIAT